MKATTVKVYKNARGNDLRNAHKSIDCCHHFCRLWVYRNKIFAFHTSSSAYYFTRSPSNVECSRWNKMKKLIITKVDETDRPFLSLVCFVSPIQTTCSKWENKTHKLDLWEKSLCKKMLTWSYDYHFCHWFSQSRWAHSQCKKKGVT